MVRRRSSAWKNGRSKKIFDRDEGVCQLCFQAIDQDGPDNALRFSADHIIPQSWGAPNALWNMRAAHKDCNVRRANKIHLESDVQSLAKNIQIMMGGSDEDRIASAHQLINAFSQFKNIMDSHRAGNKIDMDKIPPIVRSIRQGRFPWG